jgi:hypothetical protein
MLTISSCKKDTVINTPTASIMIVNAVVGGTSGRLGSNQISISSNGSRLFNLKSGSYNIYAWPLGDSLHPYFVQNGFSVEDKVSYSLYLCGTPLAPEGILFKDNVPYYSDSTFGVRFVNLAPNSAPLNITLSSTPTVTEVTNLEYKKYSGFIAYAAKNSNSYTFQIRATNSPGTVLASMAFSASAVPRFANITLVIRQNGSGVAVYRVNNDR